jgi:hypothetical protein
MTAEVDMCELARLAFWARYMVMIKAAGMSWPGFSYSDAEWARMQTLATAVDDGPSALFKIINAGVFIALVAAGMFGVWLPLVSLLFPTAAETKPLSFVLLLLHQ